MEGNAESYFSIPYPHSNELISIDREAGSLIVINWVRVRIAMEILEAERSRTLAPPRQVRKRTESFLPARQLGQENAKVREVVEVQGIVYPLPAFTFSN
jgi:hypothetical protein